LLVAVGGRGRYADSLEGCGFSRLPFSGKSATTFPFDDWRFFQRRAQLTKLVFGSFFDHPCVGFYRLLLHEENQSAAPMTAAIPHMGGF
jgi:hypothetical protein